MYKNAMALDNTLLGVVPLKGVSKEVADCYGIEIELEGSGVATAGPDVTKYWAPVIDNSLRAHNGGQAIEYVFKEPLNGYNMGLAIDTMYDFLNSPNVKVHDSYRTSIHVHLNFGMEKYRTIYNFMALSLILDELLVSQNGDHRIGNNFCLRARDAMGQTNSLMNSIDQGSEFFGLDQNGRYSSINFASLLKFGTIEFRSLECTTHKGRLMHWIHTLQHIKNVSRQFKDPTEIISQFSKMGPKDFLYMVLGPYAVKYQAVEGYTDMLHNGMRIAQDFAYCSHWTALEPGKKPAKQPAKVKYPGQGGPGGAWNILPVVHDDDGHVIDHVGAILNHQGPPQPIGAAYHFDDDPEEIDQPDDDHHMDFEDDDL